jgi:transposase
VRRRTAAGLRLDALIELFGAAYADTLSSDYTKTALVVLKCYADPRALKRLGRKRLTVLVIRASRGNYREAKADDLLAAADEAIALWAGRGLDFAELAEDIASEVRVIVALDAEIAAADDRIDALYDEADPAGFVRSAPGIRVTLAAGVLGRTGDLNRFANLAGVRSFTGIVPKIDQSGLTNGHHGLTKAGDPGLRQALYLAADLKLGKRSDPGRPLPPTHSVHPQRALNCQPATGATVSTMNRSRTPTACPKGRQIRAIRGHWRSIETSEKRL